MHFHFCYLSISVILFYFLLLFPFRVRRQSLISTSLCLLGRVWTQSFLLRGRAMQVHFFKWNIPFNMLHSIIFPYHYNITHWCFYSCILLLNVSHAVSDDEETMSEMAYPSSRSRFAKPGRSSSRAMMPLRRLDTLTEVPSVAVVDERRRQGGRRGGGAPRLNSSSSDSRVPFPRPRQHFQPSADAGNTHSDNVRNGSRDAEEEEQEPTSPPAPWSAEPRDPANSGVGNPLLRRPQWNPKKPWKF